MTKQKESELKKRVAIYTRVSGEDQKKEGLSLDAQKNKLEDYALNKGWWVYKIYTDEGITAKDIKGRKAFTQLLEDARAEKFSAILITKFDRPFRNTVEALITLDELHTIGVDFISLAESIDTTTPMGKMVFTMIAAFAQLERELTAVRVNDINEYKFNKGILVGKPPFGYKFKYKKVGKNKIVDKLIPDSTKSVLVIKLFEMKSQGKNWKEICNEINISHQTYYNILKNKTYIGIISYNGSEKKGSHEPIISEELFRSANQNVE